MKLGGAVATPFDPTTTVVNGSDYAAVGAHVPLPPSGGPALSIVTALADNLLQGNAHDPAPGAKALATSSTAAAVAAAAASHWASFWGSHSASISLPSSPAVEAYWRGALYATACMTPSTEVLTKYDGQAPPSGLCELHACCPASLSLAPIPKQHRVSLSADGPWVSSDRPGWNGDCECTSTACC